MGTGGPFSGGTARPGRDADHSPPSSAKVVNKYELYHLSLQAPPWRAAGLLYILFHELSPAGVITTTALHSQSTRRIKNRPVTAAFLDVSLTPHNQSINQLGMHAVCWRGSFFGNIDLKSENNVQG
jgi:hypothetical protein